MDFFRTESAQTMLLDILFILSRENESISYRQGMHEVAALILWVVEQDKVVVTSPPTASQPYVPVHACPPHVWELAAADSGGLGTECRLDQLIAASLDADYVEHDTYTLLAIIMETMLPWFDTGSKPRRPGNPSASSDLRVCRGRRPSPFLPPRPAPTHRMLPPHPTLRPRIRACSASRRPQRRYVSVPPSGPAVRLASPHILTSTPCAHPQAQSMTPVVRKCHKIQHLLLKQYDPALYSHLNGLGIEPQLYGMYGPVPPGPTQRVRFHDSDLLALHRGAPRFALGLNSRWLRLLFAREFHINDVLRLWDGIFADDPRLSVVDYMSVAMLLFIRDGRNVVVHNAGLGAWGLGPGAWGGGAWAGGAWAGGA